MIRYRRLNESSDNTRMNGRYLEVKNGVGEWCDLEAVVQLMDDDIRERLANSGRFREGDEYEFFKAYSDLHYRKYGEDFVPWVGGNW